MSFNFVIPEMNIGGNGNSPFVFYKRGFVLGNGTTPSWQDIILSGNTALTLTNALANGLNYLKLFGGTEQDGTPSPDAPINIVSNNGVVKVSPNLFGGYTTETGYWQSDGTWSTDSNYNSYQYITLKPNTTYTISNDVAPDYWRLALFNGNTFSSRLLQQGGTSYTFTTNASENKISIAFNKNNISDVSKVQLELGSTPTPYMSYGQIYTDGTTEKVEVTGNNLIDLNAVTDGYYYDPSGTYTSSSTSRLTDYMPVEAGQNVAVYFKSLSSSGTLNVRINIFNSNKVWQSQEVLQLEPMADGTKIITPTANGYIRISANYVAPAYADWDTAYVSEILGTATAENLFKVSNYQDVQEVLTGSITRQIGIKVLDGTEEWTKNGTRPNVYVVTLTILPGLEVINPLISSHFAGTTIVDNLNTDGYIYAGRTGLNFSISTSICTTADGFKQWIADQYNAGTPVIVVYPLATATTESVTAQPLTTQAGTNIVEITQASIDNLGLEVSYKATV